MISERLSEFIYLERLARQPGIRHRARPGSRISGTGPGSRAGPGKTELFFDVFFSIFLLRFWVFLGMGNPETAKNFFGIFLVMTQKVTL